MSKRKAAIYGGSFDPPHIGHVQIIKKALEVLDIDTLIVLPAFISPFKKGHAAPADLRMKWMRRIAAFDKRIIVSDIEIKRASASYTIDTVSHFAKFFDTIYLIIGADNIKDLKKWHNFNSLNKMVKWVVATRSDIKIPKEFIRLNVDIPISSSELRKKIDPKWIPEAIKDDVIKFYN